MKALFIFLLVVLVSVTSFAQSSKSSQDSAKTKSIEGLKGLRPAGPGDLDNSKQVQLDGTIPIYNGKGEKLSMSQVEELMQKGPFMADPYINDKKEIKAFKVREITEQEMNSMFRSDAGIAHTSALIGKKAIPFSVTDLQGKTYSLESLKGKVIVLNFWFVECHPCVSEMPELNKLVEKYKGKDIVFLGISASDKAKIEKLLKTTGFTYQLIPDGKIAIESYGIDIFPANIVIDKDGVIQFSTIGIGPNNIKNLDTTISKLL